MNAGLAIPTWPLANGSLIPDFTSVGVALNFAHRTWAFVVAILIFTTAYFAIKASKEHPSFKKPAIAGMLLVVMQITLGAVTILSEKEPNWTSLHVVGGAAVLASQFVLVVRVRHLTKRSVIDNVIASEAKQSKISDFCNRFEILDCFVVAKAPPRNDIGG